MNITRETFLKQLHDTLSHLYNADQLRKSPLTDLFEIANRFDASTALRKILADAIDTFKPLPEEPDQSRAWRIFDSLFCCYVQQMSQQIVADQLSISPRQLRREQHAALEALADYLWDRYHLQDKVADTGEAEKSAVHPGLVEELGWLKENMPGKPIDLSQELSPVLEITRTLADQNQVTVRVKIPETLPNLVIHPVILKQILVNLISGAIPYANHGRVLISAVQNLWMVELEVKTSRPEAEPPMPVAEGPDLEIDSQLAEMSGGRLAFGQDAQRGFKATLSLPVLEQYPVIAIDDNADTLQLFVRYAASSRYRLTSIQDLGEVIPLIEKIHPRIIILDIMMPNDNGWMVLGRLRQHPLTNDIPIIVCTILPQEKLSLSLGASGFLKKPVTRQSFLAALDQQYALMESESG